MFINLQFENNAEDYDPKVIGPHEVFPSVPSSITSIQTQLSALMDKLNALDIRPIANDLKHTLETSNATLDQLHRATRKINGLLESEDTRELPRTLRVTLGELQQTLDGFQQGAPAYGEFNRSLDRLNRVLDDVAPLARTLRNDPNALIFGPAEGKDPTPKAAR
jgi:paraquat-inducible protein B